MHQRIPCCVLRALRSDLWHRVCMIAPIRIVLVSGLLSTALAFSLATPAQAADADPASITVTRDGTDGIELSSAALIAAVGDTFTVVNTTDAAVDVFDVFGSITAAGTACPSTAKCAVPAGTSQVFVITELGSIAIENQGRPGTGVIVTMTFRGFPPPPDVLQQVGRPAAGCSSFSDPSLNWAGVEAGGWSESWAMWVNGGSGGPVCTRTLSFSVNLNRWIVRATPV
jgi:hypothetical protein